MPAIQATKLTSPGPVTPGRQRGIGVRWRIFLVLLGIITINYVDRGAISVALPLIQQDLHFSAADEGFILSAFFWTYAFMQIPGGYIADRFSSRVVATICTGGWGLAQAVTGLVSSVGGFYVLRMLLGFFEGPIYPTGGKLNGVWMPKRDRSRGATLLDGGAPLGSAIGGILVSGLIIATGSWRVSFIIVGLITIGVAVYVYWYVRDRPRDHHAISSEELEYINTEHEKDKEQALKSLGTTDRNVVDKFKPLYKYMRFPSFWYMCFAWFGFDMVFYGILTWGPSYLHQTKGFDIKAIGYSTLVIFGAGFIGELVGGYISDKWRAYYTNRGLGPHDNLVNRTLLGFAGAFVIAALVGVTYVPNAIWAVAFLSIVLFFLRWVGIMWSVPSALGGPKDAGTLGGAMNLSGNIAGVLIPIFVGLIVQATGSFHWALIVFIGGGLIMFLSVVLLNYQRQLPA